MCRGVLPYCIINGIILSIEIPDNCIAGDFMAWCRPSEIHNMDPHVRNIPPMDLPGY